MGIQSGARIGTFNDLFPFYYPNLFHVEVQFQTNLCNFGCNFIVLNNFEWLGFFQKFEREEVANFSQPLITHVSTILPSCIPIRSAFLSGYYGTILHSWSNTIWKYDACSLSGEISYTSNYNLETWCRMDPGNDILLYLQSYIYLDRKYRKNGITTNRNLGSAVRSFVDCTGLSLFYLYFFRILDFMV